jgi:2-polyprenyl-3-methyl-5-hydroxy-6-metoxy-1,4-benzoquinol methylase
VCVLVVGVAIASVVISGPAPRVLVGFAACVLALAASLYYCPDYLHLSIHRDKGAKWALKIRWRIIAGIAIIGLLTAPGTPGRVDVLIVVATLTFFLLIARKPPLVYLPYYFWATDLTILFVLAMFREAGPWLAVCFLAVAAHLSIVIVGQRKDVNWWTIVVLVTGSLLLVRVGPSTTADLMMALMLFVAAAIGTAFLTQRAITHHAANETEALKELVAFTGHPAEEVRRRWRESHKELAKRWQAAAIPENDHARMKEWYRQNSGHYLFDISAHNLEYKKLISNLRMLRLAKGSVLDYGAGNGEIVLELAARSHAATYYDVDGETLRFARWRAQQRGLNIDFATTKEELPAGKDGRFDTIFSFDVLEHLPDLMGELSFLASLLRKGGVLVCDVPAGATKNHPMHLNHELNVSAHLRAQGLTDRRTLLQRLVLSREKYIFQA